MLYIIADRQKTAGAGISIKGCRVNGEHVIVNEKDLNILPGETLEERASVIGGKIYDVFEIKKLIIKGDW